MAFQRKVLKWVTTHWAIFFHRVLLSLNFHMRAEQVSAHLLSYPLSTGCCHLWARLSHVLHASPVKFLTRPQPPTPRPFTSSKKSSPATCPPFMSSATVLSCGILEFFAKEGEGKGCLDSASREVLLLAKRCLISTSPVRYAQRVSVFVCPLSAAAVVSIGKASFSWDNLTLGTHI